MEAVFWRRFQLGAVGDFWCLRDKDLWKLGVVEVVVVEVVVWFGKWRTEGEWRAEWIMEFWEVMGLRLLILKFGKFDLVEFRNPKWSSKGEGEAVMALLKKKKKRERVCVSEWVSE